MATSNATLLEATEWNRRSKISKNFMRLNHLYNVPKEERFITK